MSTIAINHEPNSMKEIKLLSRMTWKEIVSMLVRTDEKFLTDLWGTYDSDKQNHAVKLTISETKDDRYAVAMEFVWRDKDGYHKSSNTQEFFVLQYMPDFVWKALHGPQGEYSVMLHASELQEYKPIILNYKDNKVQICDSSDGIIDLVCSQLKKSHADSGSYCVEIIPQKLLTKVVVYYDSVNRYECLSFYTVFANELTSEQNSDLADGKSVTINVVFKRFHL